MIIRESKKEEIVEVEKVHMLAFGDEEGSTIVKLVHNLFKDKTAEPYLSLIALEEERIVGHILFTKASIGNSEANVQILAPLAVLPEYQNKGIGGILIKEGIKKLKSKNGGLVFVLGYPKYYSRFGFKKDAKKYGYNTPFPIEDKDKDAWMVQELKPGLICKERGMINCAKTLQKQKYWKD